MLLPSTQPCTSPTGVLPDAEPLGGSVVQALIAASTTPTTAAARTALVLMSGSLPGPRGRRGGSAAACRRASAPARSSSPRTPRSIVEDSALQPCRCPQ